MAILQTGTPVCPGEREREREREGHTSVANLAFVTSQNLWPLATTNCGSRRSQQLLLSRIKYHQMATLQIRPRGPGGEVIKICLVLVQDSAYIGVEREGNYGPVKSHLADNYYHRGSNVIYNE